MSKRKKKKKKRKCIHQNKERKIKGKEVHQDLNQVRLFLQVKMMIEFNIFIKITYLCKFKNRKNNIMFTDIIALDHIGI